MKLFKLSAIAGLLVLLTTGCSIRTESPEGLVKTPIYNSSKLELSEGIVKLLAKASLTLPGNSKEVGKINEVDLDNDGINEIVALEKKKKNNDSEDEVGFIILSEKLGEEKPTYIDRGDFLEKGEAIEYANFYDLDNDGYKEIILLIKHENKTNMYIYRFKDNEISKIYTLNPTWLENKDDLLNMKVQIGYIDDDRILDILMLHLDSKTNELYVSIADFNGDINFKDFVKIENVKNVSELYVSLGNVAKLPKETIIENKEDSKVKKGLIKGVVLDIPTIKENNYITQIIYMEDGKLEKAFKDNDKNIMKAYYIPSRDINHDNVIDIPIVNGNGHTYTSKTSANISWNSWNGKKGENSSLIFNSQVYYNYKYNYKILIPDILKDKIDVQEEFTNENISFKFNYYDTILMESKTLFTIVAMNKNMADEKKSINHQNAIILKESEDYSFVLYANDIEEMDKLDITTNALREYFSLIYE